MHYTEPHHHIPMPEHAKPRRETAKVPAALATMRPWDYTPQDAIRISHRVAAIRRQR